MHFLQSLNRSYYHVQEFGIQKNGGWLVGSQARFMLEQGHEQQMQIPFTAEVVEELMQCDVLIPVLHGPRGEDGAIQGFFELLGKAYVGCDHRSAAVSMDKLICKKIAWQEGLKTAACIDFSSYQWQQDQACLMTQIQTHLTLPVFVKPIHLGSSVGVKKVDRWEELVQAIHEAFKYDTHLIIENGIVGREVEFAVLGLHQITVFPPGEILNHGAVYDYQSKYSDQAASTTPCADLPQEVAAMGQQLAEKIFRAIGCQGLARVDFFLDQQGTYWFNEINPMPGFTATSLYPQMCAHHGLTSSLLMDQLVILALSRKRQQERLH
jgi:UDP-N-acetylmuramate--alanine ligase